MIDYLIVGQGIAGSFLAWHLKKRGKSVLIVDEHHKQSSSIMSAGIINPITGKRFVLMPEFDHYKSHALQAYKDLEQVLQTQIFASKDIIRCFKNEDELEEWNNKKGDRIFQEYVRSFNPSDKYQTQFNNPYGSLEILQGGVCNAVSLLEGFKNYFLDEKNLVLEKFHYDDLQICDQFVKFRGEPFKNVIFCEGYQGQFNPWFQHLKFNSAKGEILHLEIDDANLPDAIISKEKWCAPLGQHRWAVGATYDWDQRDCESSEEAKIEILQDFDQFIAQKRKVVKHQAGVRPVMKNQKIIAERHPDIPFLGILNGLGSKGFLMAPYVAEEFSLNLTKGY